MRYYLNLFSPQTAEVFARSSHKISGFTTSGKTYIDNQQIGPGDRLVCYCTKIQRLIGILEVQSHYYIDDTPHFAEQDDPYIIRFHVEPIVWLPLEQALPIRSDLLWPHLSFTRNLPCTGTAWTYMVLGSPKLWPEADARLIEERLLAQSRNPQPFPLSPQEQKKAGLIPMRPRKKKKDDPATPRPRPEPDKPKKGNPEERESLKVQAALARIGEVLGYRIWLPSGDRTGVAEYWKPKKEEVLLEEIPFLFDPKTLETIRNIDVLWVKKMAIVRAFEVEGTTAIYSGLLRMADLLTMQPMLDIPIHIVAPGPRKNLVFKQINRPVFASLGKKGLARVCTYLSYESVYKLASAEDLCHMKNTIIEKYTESALPG